MTFLDLFSGIGGFRLAMEQAGHVCVGHCEIDTYANKSYIAMHRPRRGEWYADDITRVRAEEMPRADCWCFGFPCQDISIAGKQRGFAGQRSSLFLTVTDLIRGQEEKDRPSYLLIENVKNLLSVNRGSILHGSSWRWTKSGTMQSGHCSTLPMSSLKTERGFSLSDILEDDVPEKYFLSEKMVKRLISYKGNGLMRLQHVQGKMSQSDVNHLLKVNSMKKA